MKLKILFLLSIMIVMHVACEEDRPPSLSIVNASEVYKGDCPEDDCAEVSIDYIIFKGDENISNKINTKITDFIITSLMLNAEDTIMTSTTALAAEKFLNTFYADKNEFPEISPYFAEISVSNSYRSKEILCMEMNQYLYTGGAHGYGTTWFLNIDIDTGEEIPSRNLLKNEQEFVIYAEKIFREKMGIPMGESINSTGFWFENDTFYLPETLGFQDNNLIILYNPYEISSYASGMIEVSIPLEEVIPYLQFK